MNRKVIIGLGSLAVAVAVALALFFWLGTSEWKGVKYRHVSTDETLYIKPHPEAVDYADCWLDEIHATIKSSKHESLDSIAAECEDALPTPKVLFDHWQLDRDAHPRMTNWDDCNDMYRDLIHSRDQHRRKTFGEISYIERRGVDLGFIDAACTEYTRR